MRLIFIGFAIILICLLVLFLNIMLRMISAIKVVVTSRMLVFKSFIFARFLVFEGFRITYQIYRKISLFYFIPISYIV